MTSRVSQKSFRSGFDSLWIFFAIFLAAFLPFLSPSFTASPTWAPILAPATALGAVAEIAAPPVAIPTPEPMTAPTTPPRTPPIVFAFLLMLRVSWVSCFRSAAMVVVMETSSARGDTRHRPLHLSQLQRWLREEPPRWQWL